jgi:uncharacterized protein
MDQFSVTEARTAIACPRIFYFDEQRFREGKVRHKRVTRIWTSTISEVVPSGSLFHQTVERFNATALRAEGLRQALVDVSQHPNADPVEHVWSAAMRFLNANVLPINVTKQTAAQQAAFVRAVHQYVRELAEVMVYSVRAGRGVEETLSEFFGDSRKRVDVTFYVGVDGEPIRVRGSLDYIYFDYRQQRHRVIDFKLQRPDAVSKDLLQTALYALMHHQQHGTSPDAAVMYLHPERQVVDQSWDQVSHNQTKVYDLLASMSAWVRFNEVAGTGTKPPGNPDLCARCPWNRGGVCEKRLGAHGEGEMIKWHTDQRSALALPQMVRTTPPEPEPLYEIDDVEEDSSKVNERVASAGPTRSREPQKSEPTLVLGETVSARLPVAVPLSALNTHISIVGAAGSGKSWLAKVVAEEAIRNGVPVLAIDPQGDLVQFLKESNGGLAASGDQAERHRAFRDRAEVRVWTPGTSHGIRLRLSPLRIPSLDEVQEDTPQRQQEEWESILGVNASNLAELAASSGDRSVQETFFLQLLRGLTQQVGGDEVSLSRIISAVREPAVAGMEDPDAWIAKRDRERLAQRLQTRLHGPSANLFTGGTSLDLARMVQPVAPGRVPLNVIYLNAMAGDQAKQLFVAALAAEIYRWMITSPSTGRARLLVYLDEAKDFLPKGTSSPPAKKPLLRLFAQGRKFGVGGLVCTQSPRSVDYEVFSNTSTKLIGRLEAAQDTQRVAEWFASAAGGPPRWLAGRTSAGPGEMIGRWPKMPDELDGETFKSRPLYSLHEGAWSPDRVEAEWRENSLASHFEAGDGGESSEQQNATIVTPA